MRRNQQFQKLAAISLEVIKRRWYDTWTKKINGPEANPFFNLESAWHRDFYLKTDIARRQALIELDVLGCVCKHRRVEHNRTLFTS